LSQRQVMPQPAVPCISEGPYRLSFALEGDDEFYLLLSFPGPRGPRYPVRGYPAITEFQAMLSLLASGATQSWSGAHFAGGVAESNEHGPVCWFRAHDNGITLRCRQTTGNSCARWWTVRGTCQTSGRRGTRWRSSTGSCDRSRCIGGRVMSHGARDRQPAACLAGLCMQPHA
jgi:hypothetical protein